ncbi:MAG TPA: hypothetical protein VI461_06800, partial [Chitinophagaceae bacterium]|nr:hypothetical protein [Chitinophagaceae bacterium]
MLKSKIFFRILKVLTAIALLLAIGLFLLFRITTSVTANLDSYEYYLPFKKGYEYHVSQGYGGLFTHKHIAAIDFDMPIGTLVYAAREGIVYSYKNDSDEGGPFPKYKKK